MIRDDGIGIDPKVFKEGLADLVRMEANPRPPRQAVHLA